MAILYVDFTNGSDANNGSTFALRCKTITSGITAARTAPGDTIRLMKSEDPVSLGINATFTNLSDTVTLASGLTANIYASGAWTASANVTCTTSTTRKEGATSSSNAIAAGFTTGLISYYATGTLDLSGYTKCSFWVRSSTALAAGVLSLKLCTDTAGAAAAHTFTINQALGANSWTCLTFDNGSALSSAIASVALYAISDPVTPTILIDNVIACNNLTLTSVIGLTSSPTSFDFYPIKSINGTTVKLDMGANADAAATARGWFGTTTTATIYKIEPIRPSNLYNAIQEAGTDAFTRSMYSGGWDSTDMSTQTGLTWIDTGDAAGSVLTCSVSFIDFEKIVTVRGSTGINLSAASLKFTNCAAIGSGGNGFAVGAQNIALVSCTSNNHAASGANVTTHNNSIYEFTSCNTASAGINFSTALYCRVRNAVCCNNAGTGITFGSGGSDVFGLTARNNATYGLSVTAAAGIEIRAFNVVTSGNTTAGVGALSGRISITGADCTDATPFTATTAVGIINVNNLSGNAGTSRIYSRNGSTITAQLEAATLHGSATKNWKHIPQASHTADAPQVQKIDRIAVAASGTLTFSVWVQRSATTASAMLVLRGGQCSGVSSDLTAQASAAINTWEKLSITCTPGQATALEFELHTWRNTSAGGNVFFSDFSVIQA